MAMRTYSCNPPDHLLTSGGQVDVVCRLPGFNGQISEPLTGHFLLGNGYRAFNPVVMRCNSPDNLSPFAAGGINAYAYCRGDPVNRQDPDGHIGRIAQRHLRVRIKNLVKIKAPVRAAPVQGFGLGDLDVFEGTPLVMDRVLASLPGDDLVAFSLVSKRAKRAVDRVVRPLGINVSAQELSRSMIVQLRDISLGRAQRYLPAEVRRWRNLRSMAAESPASDVPMQETIATGAYIEASNERIRRWQASKWSHQS